MPDVLPQTPTKTISRDGGSCMRIQLGESVSFPLRTEGVDIRRSVCKAGNAVQNVEGFPCRAKQRGFVRKQRGMMIRTGECLSLFTSAVCGSLVHKIPATSYLDNYGAEVESSFSHEVP